MGLKTTPIGFADDVNLIAYGRSTGDNCETLTKAHRACDDWAEKHGAAFAPQKYELIHLTKKPWRYDMDAQITLRRSVIAPQADIRILGIQIDTKLSWGPHLTKVEKKHARQMLAMSAIGASTWGATFTRARQVYSAVVRSSMTYASPAWHVRSDNGKLRGRHRRLEILQNQGLRNATGAFKRTSTDTLEAEAFIPPIGLFMDRLQDKATLRRRNAGQTQATREICDKIHGKIRGIERGRKDTPGERKLRILNAIIEKGRSIHRRKHPTRNPGQERIVNEEKAIDVYHLDQWEKRWESYQNRNGAASVPPARRHGIGKETVIMRKNLHKAESTMATHIRTECIGLKAYLTDRKVPGYLSAACSCGFARQTAKHILMHCPLYAERRAEMLRAVGTQDYRTLTASAKGLKEASKFMIRTNLLEQFSLADILLYGTQSQERY